MRIGILTGGGDCPGLNAAIRAVVLTARFAHDDDVVGFIDGWRGVLEGDVVPLEVEGCRDLLPVGGTILGTSRTNPFSSDGGPEKVVASLSRTRSMPSWRSEERTPSGLRTGLATTASDRWVCPRRSTTTWRAPTSPSGSTPRC